MKRLYKLKSDLYYKLGFFIAKVCYISSAILPIMCIVFLVLQYLTEGKTLQEGFVSIVNCVIISVKLFVVGVICMYVNKIYDILKVLYDEIDNFIG